MCAGVGVEVLAAAVEVPLHRGDVGGAAGVGGRALEADRVAGMHSLAGAGIRSRRQIDDGDLPRVGDGPLECQNEVARSSSVTAHPARPLRSPRDRRAPATE